MPAPAAATSYALIEGSGSSWAANAVNQWVADVHSQGMEVDYTPSGDAQGRQDYANRTSDFAVTSLGYQGRDPVTGVDDTSQGRPYAYLPIAAGGTAFPYQIKVQGTQVRNLRLSGETLTKIFTNQITNWDDPAITEGQQRASRCRRCRSRRWCSPRAPARPRSSRATSTPSTRASGSRSATASA